ncbi:MAG TPA: porin [Spongiibacteraceae bacterium]|nr:porin [Spongiibacteraceae bacterium]HUH36515.1 porin [Spongiibacteraceae bacterium]
MLRLHPCQRLRPVLCAPLLAMLATVAEAQPQPLDQRFSWAGFGTLGVVYNDTDDMQFVRDLNQPSGPAGEWSTEPDTLLGLQARYRFTHKLDATVQLVSRYTYTSSYAPQVTWANLKYSPNAGMDLRLGRMGWDIYMLSDSRNVGYSYLWVRPPLEYFGLQQISHIDGADAVFRGELAGGLAWLKVYAGLADEELPSLGSRNYDLKGSEVYGAHINYQTRHWWFRVGYANATLDQELDSLEPLLTGLNATGLPSAAAAADELGLEGAEIRQWTAGVVYERGAFLSQLMFDHSTSDSLTFPDHQSWYFLLSYRVGEFTPYVSIAQTDASRDTVDTGLAGFAPQLDAAAQAAAEASLTDQRSVAMGVRYDFMPKLALKLQIDQLDAKNGRSMLVRNPEPDWDGKATIFSATLDFVF